MSRPTSRRGGLLLSGRLLDLFDMSWDDFIQLARANLGQAEAQIK